MKRSFVNIGRNASLFCLACYFFSAWLLPFPQSSYVALGGGAVMVIGIVIDLFLIPVTERKRQLWAMFILGIWGTSLSLLFSVRVMINISLAVGAAWVVWHLIKEAVDYLKKPST